MIQLIRKYKSVLLFILTFLGVYLVLSFLYTQYLNIDFSESYYPDYITHRVAGQSEWLIDKMGYSSIIEPHDLEPSMKLFIEGVFVARVVEGCNAISVIILFASFVLAFFQGWGKTFSFICIGSVLIYGINILRIAILSIGLYTYPEYKAILHDIVFPGIIYGLVVFLWVFWVSRFKKQKS
ncbi:exosortase family protein XrtF [Leeuwenhoekiella aestuarii]|uniref:Exosortase family protein XrtF n=1 Tax=Leeuwenhoekiella aestuarii TaxID=2249426 RepID=A0A4Q0NS64_9FLAO|nr:exosortase family protein XrtF [Leeuwenhoekiella aestuarii]RXG12693.1 exosortase family protein XrtF [Leeuwenhoekiella aestuarii]